MKYCGHLEIDSTVNVGYVEFVPKTQLSPQLAQNEFVLGTQLNVEANRRTKEEVATNRNKHLKNRKKQLKAILSLHMVVSRRIVVNHWLLERLTY